MEKDFTPQCKDIGYLIWRITKFWQRSKHKTLDEFGLTGSQLETLGAVYHMKTENLKITQVALSQITETDPMTTSTVVKNLEKKGLVTRKESQTDTRAREVEITDAGIELFNKAIDKIKEKQEIVFSRLDKEALINQLEILLNVLDELRDENIKNNKLYEIK